jgi:group II intron reverse transcriptase/maturase
MELSGPGVQYIADNQLYNSIITAHAILMSAPLSFEKRLVRKGLTNESSCVKDYQAGEAKLHEETQTAKLIGKGVNGTDAQVLGRTPDLICTTFRLTNLITRKILHNRNFVKWADRANALFTLILSLVLELLSKNNGITRREKKHYARNRVQNAASRNYGIAYGHPIKRVANNQAKNLGPCKGGDGVVVVGYSNNIWRTTVSNLQVRTLSSKAGSNATRGSEGKNTLDSNEVNIKAISNIKNLVAAYELIKSNPGNMTKGADDVTLDGIDLNYFLKVQSKLKAGTYEFNPARRIQIPKPGKSETRPLTIASPREKIVQKAILLIMERLYENKFLDTSHGFRPARGTHTAIKQLQANFQSARYIIQADFSKAFDSIQHDALLGIIEEEIKCEKTLRLIKSGLKAGYLGELHNNLAAGTPQGSILSPLLCNVFLHKLDEYVEDLKKKYHKGVKRQRAPENMRLQNKARRTRGYDKSRPVEYRLIIQQLLKTPSMKRDDSFVRLNYVRYADDFVVGVEGSYKLAKEILSKIESFVNNELKLKFNPDKTTISKFAEKPFKFLGYSIRAPLAKRGIKPLETIRVNGNRITRRNKVRIIIEMDVAKVLKKLANNGFIRKRTSHTLHNELEYRGTFKGNLINLDHPDILKYYNSVLRGLQNYYSFARNRSAIARVGWLLKESCALTLARKFKLKTAAKAFEKFNKDLGFDIDKDKRISFIGISYAKAVNIAKATTMDQDPIKSIDTVWNAKFTKSKLTAPCVICGNTTDVEMHHVRQIRDMKNPNSKLDFFTRQMAAINRKQVALCKDHHIRLHNNMWTDEERATFNYEAKRKKIRQLKSS